MNLMLDDPRMTFTPRASTGSQVDGGVDLNVMGATDDYKASETDEAVIATSAER